MIIVTGAAGFIGSCVVAALLEDGIPDLVLVDDFSRADKLPNWNSKTFREKVERELFFDWVNGKEGEITAFIHLGARTDTAGNDPAVYQHLNLNYTKQVWTLCRDHAIPLVYASSAATYGDGSLGFKDSHSLVPHLKPLNLYGESKNDFDRWALEQDKTPPFWAGLKFFNVYGPNEYHKGRMASVVFHAFNQIKSSGKLKLFRSHNPEFQDGEQLRDFVYVKDVVHVIRFLLDRQPTSGLYNLGTGTARTFLSLGRAVFNALELEPQIEFIDTPADIRDKYQYYTQAEMQKLIETGFSKDFSSLEDGIRDYVDNYLRVGGLW
jgi:ADP-L-glycero-D-manno-heptose 6-epimerase